VLIAFGIAAFVVSTVAVLSHNGGGIRQRLGATSSRKSVPTKTPQEVSEVKRAEEYAAADVYKLKVNQIAAAAYLVQWKGPEDPSIAGWIIAQYPAKGSASYAPYPDPELSSRIVTEQTFEPQVKFQPGEKYTVCVIPFDHGYTSDGQYPEISDDKDCAPAFTWKSWE